MTENIRKLLAKHKSLKERMKKRAKKFIIKNKKNYIQTQGHFYPHTDMNTHIRIYTF